MVSAVASGPFFSMMAGAPPFDRLLMLASEAAGDTVFFFVTFDISTVKFDYRAERVCEWVSEKKVEMGIEIEL